MPTIPQTQDSSENFNRWRPFWIGTTDSFWEHLIGVETGSTWRLHTIWSKESGQTLRAGLVQRFSSITIFLSVIVAAEVGVITSAAQPVDAVRIALANHDLKSFEFWTGVFLAVATSVSIAALIANYSAWAVFHAISDENLKVIARSSIGIYAAQLPNRLIIFVNYLFLAWIGLFLYVMMPIPVAITTSVAAIIALVFFISGNSALANIIMNSGAMSEFRIVDEQLESKMTPTELSEELLRRKRKRQTDQTPVNQLYRRRPEPNAT